jgi:lipopolysaccharide export system protein LptA
MLLRTLGADQSGFCDKRFFRSIQVTYYVDEDRSVVTSGGDTRVISIIHPKAKKNDAAKGK